MQSAALHSPRRLPAPSREQLKATLDDLIKQQIVAPVTESTPWINSMVVVPKKNGTLRICLDPKGLNCYIKREHYQLPIIDTSRQSKAVHSIGCFWYAWLDAPSSLNYLPPSLPHWPILMA